MSGPGRRSGWRPDVTFEDLPRKSEAVSNAAFWSADSARIVFPARRQLMKTRLPDGAPETIAPLPLPTRGGSWSEGTILIAAAGELLAGPASGGALKAFSGRGRRKRSSREPWLRAAT